MKQNTSKKLLAFFTMVSLITLSCNALTPNKVSDPREVYESVNESGGTYQNSIGIKVVVPKNAIEGKGKITIKPAKPPEAQDPIAALGFYLIEITGAKIKGPVQISFPLSDDLNRYDYKILHYSRADSVLLGHSTDLENSQVWLPLPTKIENETASAWVDSFSFFALQSLWIGDKTLIGSVKVAEYYSGGILPVGIIGSYCLGETPFELNDLTFIEIKGAIVMDTTFGVGTALDMPGLDTTLAINSKTYGLTKKEIEDLVLGDICLPVNFDFNIPLRNFIDIKSKHINIYAVLEVHADVFDSVVAASSISNLYTIKIGEKDTFNEISVIPSSGKPGDPVTLTGLGYAPNEEVDITSSVIDLSINDSVWADSNGKFVVPFYIPENADLDAIPINATGQTSKITNSTTFSILKNEEPQNRRANACLDLKISDGTLNPLVIPNSIEKPAIITFDVTDQCKEYESSEWEIIKNSPLPANLSLNSTGTTLTAEINTKNYEAGAYFLTVGIIYPGETIPVVANANIVITELNYFYPSNFSESQKIIYQGDDIENCTQTVTTNAQSDPNERYLHYLKEEYYEGDCPESWKNTSFEGSIDRITGLVIWNDAPDPERRFPGFLGINLPGSVTSSIGPNGEKFSVVNRPYTFTDGPIYDSDGVSYWVWEGKVNATYDQVTGKLLSYQWTRKSYYTGGEWNHSETDSWQSAEMVIENTNFPYGIGSNSNQINDTGETCNTSTIPDVIGMSLPQASDTLGKLGYGFTWKDDRYQETHFGSIVRQEPEPGGCYDPRTTIVVMYRNIP
jgi:hypothetical protein